MGAAERDIQQKTEATMNRSSILKRAILPLIGIGLSLSACAGRPGGYGYGGYPAYPAYGVFDYGYGGWGGWHHGWDHSHWDHGGFDGHGGGGHR